MKGMLSKWQDACCQSIVFDRIDDPSEDVSHEAFCVHIVRLFIQLSAMAILTLHLDDDDVDKVWSRIEAGLPMMGGESPSVAESVQKAQMQNQREILGEGSLDEERSRRKVQHEDWLHRLLSRADALIHGGSKEETNAKLQRVKRAKKENRLERARSARLRRLVGSPGCDERSRSAMGFEGVARASMLSRNLHRSMTRRARSPGSQTNLSPSTSGTPSTGATATPAAAPGQAQQQSPRSAWQAVSEPPSASLLRSPAASKGSGGAKSCGFAAVRSVVSPDGEERRRRASRETRPSERGVERQTARQTTRHHTAVRHAPEISNWDQTVDPTECVAAAPNHSSATHAQLTPSSCDGAHSHCAQRRARRPVHGASLTTSAAMGRAAGTRRTSSSSRGSSPTARSPTSAARRAPCSPPRIASRAPSRRAARRRTGGRPRRWCRASTRSCPTACSRTTTRPR